MSCGNCKSVAKMPLFCNFCYQNAKQKAKEEGRKEGAITELKDLERHLIQYNKYCKGLLKEDKNDGYVKGLRDKAEGILEYVEKRLKELE
jgi:hypothetical protein